MNASKYDNNITLENNQKSISKMSKSKAKSLSDMYSASNDTYVSLLNKYLYTYNANLDTYTYLNQIFVKKDGVSSIIDDREIQLYTDTLQSRYAIAKSWDQVERWIIFDFSFKINDLKNNLEKLNVFVFFHLVSNAVLILKKPSILQLDDIDLKCFCNNMSLIDKVNIGLELIFKTGPWKKEYIGKWKTISLSDKEVKFYLPKNNEKPKDNILTYSRLVTVTAWDTAEYLVSKKGSSFLARSIGWECIYDDEVFKKLTDIESTITREILILPSIPKLMPHKYLNLNQIMADIFVVFHAVNDVFIKFKNRNKKECTNSNSFLTNTIRKLSNIGITANMASVSKYITIIAPACFNTRKTDIMCEDMMLEVLKLFEEKTIKNTKK